MFWIGGKKDRGFIRKQQTKLKKHTKNLHTFLYQPCKSNIHIATSLCT